jgi:glutathione S-transferase
MRLYVVAASHPCYAVEAALRLKDLSYERVVLPIGLSAPLQLARFGRRTVPGLVTDEGYRVVGSRLIMRTLDGLVAEPALLPADAAAREEVLAAERWGDEELQEAARWVMLRAGAARPDCMWSYIERDGTPVPRAVVERMAGPNIALERRLLGIDDARIDAWLDALPAGLDRIDAWIADGVLGDPDAVNAADLQIGSSLAALRTSEDLRPLIEGRPANRLADLFPDYPGHMPAGTIRVPAGGGAFSGRVSNLSA